MVCIALYISLFRFFACFGADVLDRKKGRNISWRVGAGAQCCREKEAVLAAVRPGFTVEVNLFNVSAA